MDPAAKSWDDGRAVAKNYWRWRGWVGLLLLGLFSGALANGSASVRLVEALSRLNTVRAQFTQVTKGGGLASPVVYRGDFLLKRPHRFRWEVLAPEKQTIVSDGHTLWVYDVDLEQVSVQPVRQRFAHSPAMMLSGNVQQIEKEYQVKAVSAGAVQRYRLLARTSDAMIKQIDLAIKNGKIIAMMLTDGMGQKSQLKFTKIVINEKIPLGQFVFKIPHGVDVIHSSPHKKEAA